MNRTPTGFDEFHDLDALCRTGGLCPLGMASESLMAAGEDYGMEHLDAPEWIPGGCCIRDEDWLGESVYQHVIARHA